jgi:hypothetical protein
MTLEPNAEAPTRADALANGVKVRVVAYNGTTPESTTEYEVSGGVLTTSTALEVNTGTTYKFVAYSYNSAASPDYPGPTITVASPHDLLWGNESKTITASDYDVSITMNHLFSQVNVKATSANLTDQPKIMNMTNVTITPGATVDLPILTGIISQNATAATQTIPSWIGFNNVTVTSDPVAVNTGSANPIFVNIGSLELDGFDPFYNLQAKFTKALTAGTSYTLVVNLHETIFAGSNIYWVSTGGDDGYLTFDKGTSERSMCQGVSFKWGSLWGTSPNGGFTSSKPAYKPTSATTFTRTTGVDWMDIPEMTAPSITYTGNYLMAQGNNWSAGTGDICNFIDRDWRLPTIGEFNLDNSPYETNVWGSSSWTPIGGSPWVKAASTNDEGTSPLAYGVSIHGVVFPSSYGHASYGGVPPGSSNTTTGVYWTGSTAVLAQPFYALALSFYEGVLRFQTHPPGYAPPVRCVKIE